MANFKYTFQNTVRTAAITLNLVAVGIVLVQGYINSQFDTPAIILIVVAALNVVFFLINRPTLPEIKTEIKNVDTQTPPQAPGSQQDQA